MKKIEISTHFTEKVIDSLRYDYELSRKIMLADQERIKIALIEKLKTIGFEFSSLPDFYSFCKERVFRLSDDLKECHYHLDYKDNNNLGISFLSLVWQTNVYDDGKRIESNLIIN